MKLDAEEGKEPASKFKCNECGHEVGRLADIRRHITTKHIKPQTPGNNKRGRPSEASPEKENEKKKTKDNEEGTALSDITLASLDDPLTSSQMVGAAEFDPSDFLKVLENYEEDEDVDLDDTVKEKTVIKKLKRGLKKTTL